MTRAAIRRCLTRAIRLNCVVLTAQAAVLTVMTMRHGAAWPALIMIVGMLAGVLAIRRLRIMVRILTP